MASPIDNTFEDVSLQEPYQLESVLTVYDFTLRLQRLLENHVPALWIQGEISNFMEAASGHWYFQIKDERSQIGCVMFRSKNQRLTWRPHNGMAVELKGSTSYYAAGGKTQITIDAMRQAGLGRLFEAFSKLKNKLEQEGLFDKAHKKPLPPHPRVIGVITSPMAAALQDVISTLKRRAPAIQLILYPSRVQGEGAAAELAAAIDTANARGECDLLILCRGGGSIEDLWAYNEEILARAIYRSTLPLISGVGHETDFTIADFVADHRAPTPTAAAELVSPDRPQQLLQLQQLKLRLQQHLRRFLEREMIRLDHFQDKFPNTLRLWLSRQSTRLSVLQQRLVDPGQQIQSQQKHLSQLAIRLRLAQQRQMGRMQEKIRTLEQALIYLDPQAIMGRGFAIVRNQQGHIVTSVHQSRAHDNLSVQLADGQLTAVIDQVLPDKD